MKTPISIHALEILRDYCEQHCDGKINRMYPLLGIEPNSGLIHKWLRNLDPSAKKTMPKLDTIGGALDRIGAQLIGPDEQPLLAQPKIDTAISGSCIDKDREIHELKLALAEARGEIRALKWQLERVSPNQDSLPEQNFSKKENAG